jgi:hypothetical protein
MLYVPWEGGGNGRSNKNSRHVTSKKKIQEQMPKVETFVCFGALVDKFIMGFSFLQ